MNFVGSGINSHKTVLIEFFAKYSVNLTFNPWDFVRGILLKTWVRAGIRDSGQAASALGFVCTDQSDGLKEIHSSRWKSH